MSPRAVIMRQFEDRLPPCTGPVVYRGHYHRVFYVVEGTVLVASEIGAFEIGVDEAVLTNGKATVTSGKGGALLWRWEVLLPSVVDDGVPEASGLTSELRITAETPLPESERFLIRCERADFVLGSETPRHKHAGPGIRTLLRGDLCAEIGVHKARYRAGDAWLERGPDPVVGRSSPTEETSFIRVMILPRRLRGKTSFQYWDDSEMHKPRTGTIRTYLDEPISL